jgi:hypothetical protein
MKKKKAQAKQTKDPGPKRQTFLNLQAELRGANQTTQIIAEHAQSQQRKEGGEPEECYR